MKNGVILRKAAFTIILIAGMIIVKPVYAQNDGGKRKTDINFEDELIEGEVKKPELFYLFQKKQFNFKRLIKLRENFLPEMRRTAEEVQTGE